MSAELISFPDRQPLPDSPPRVLENAVVRLLKQKPFYGHLLLGFRRRVVQDQCGLGVTISHGTPILSVDPETLAAYSADEQVALLEHGIKHLLHLHPVRGRGVHRLTWDVATDLAINPSIANMPEAAPRPERFKLETGLAAEEYARLLTRPFDIGNLEGEGLGNASLEAFGQDDESGQSDADQSSSTPVDDHSLWNEADSTPERLAEQVVRDLVREAHRKAHGEVPEDITGLIEGWLAPPEIPWQQILRQFIGTAGRIGRQSSWQRQHRRFQHNTPGVRKRRQLKLLVAIDVSESTDEGPLRETFARELLQIARGRDSHITVLYAHSRIRRIDQFRSIQMTAEVFHGGGFTDLRPVFDYAKEMHPLPAAVIYLTDGYGPAPEEMEFPTLWVLTPDGQKPVSWGVELRLSSER
ncbi:VWA-like domain-containing protein [Deltaproteobacteria bacterium IMCC39524]|nr:VWA-like domain-containing protein [Deltaproteobacteria bacterium IMCC39524]